MSDINREIAMFNLNSAIDDYNTEVNKYNRSVTAFNDCKIKEKKSFIDGFISAYETISGEVIVIYYNNVLDRYPIISRITIIK